MKKIIALLSLVLITLTSCQITEKIYIEEDGSGRYNVEIDMSKFTNMMGGMNKKKVDSTYVAKDSIIDFSDILIKRKDSIAKLPKEYRENLKYLKGAKILMHEDESKSELSTSILGSFKNINELQNIINSIQKKEGPIPSRFDVKYTYKRGKFSRKSIEKKLSKEDEKKIKKNNSFISESIYKIEYHFPKPIKKTSLKDAKFSKDRKILYLERPLSDIINSKGLDFDVKLRR